MPMDFSSSWGKLPPGITGISKGRYSRVIYQPVGKTKPS
jgi:hypothetical protein